MRNSAMSDYSDESAIAVIGMSGRFPGANTVGEFWPNLRVGVESITFFSQEELEAAAISPDWLSHPNYVRAKGILGNIELFDASFFGFSPREAELTDPQHRLFLECSWEALESAGYDPDTYAGAIGVYGGAGASGYSLNLYLNPQYAELIGSMQSVIGAGVDHLTTRVSYKLNLRGPSLDIQTSCSTSLVAVHVACQSLLNGECDMALAGGVSIVVPQRAGYFYEEGGILSPDGHCRAFDAKSRGTVGGSGVGVVLLKRLTDALADGDQIIGVIKGSAINNDGSLKVGYLAPSLEGQAAVIIEALTMAGVEPETISYVETHGTGTALGDPIEIAALTQAFRTRTDKKGFCAIGSVKPSVGHLDTAAGITGLIKVLLALQHRELPPSLHFDEPNPAIDFANSPFFVNTRLREWTTAGAPRRAGVSSFGIGGTNAHVIVEDPPAAGPSGESRPLQLLVVSARTSSALETATANLARHLRDHPQVSLPDVAYTLQLGRKDFSYRRMLVCRDAQDAVAALESLDPQRVFTTSQEKRDRPVVFMFSGQATEYANMSRGLYQTEPVFRGTVDSCCEFLKAILNFDLRDLLYPSETEAENADQTLHQTFAAQPAIFVVEYALARLFMQWGVRPQAMIGHSLGEYVAACLAGVFSLEDALTLVAQRGQLMQQLPAGAMMSVSLPEAEVQPLLGAHLSLAAVNGPSLCAVSGPTEAIAELQERLAQQEVAHRRLTSSHAFHSQMMEPMLEQFTDCVKAIRLNAPQIPYLSNVSGTWITAAEAQDPTYWAKHIRQTVRFASGVKELFKNAQSVLLEIGPGHTLSTLARQHSDRPADQVVLSSMRHPRNSEPDTQVILNLLGRLWLAGVRIDWKGFYADEQRRRVLLPTYPFERQRYWIDPAPANAGAQASAVTLRKQGDVADWFYAPVWRQTAEPAVAADDAAAQRSPWLIFVDPCGLGLKVAERLEQKGLEVIIVQAGSRFAAAAGAYTINPQRIEDYDALFSDLRMFGKTPKSILHMWSVTADPRAASHGRQEEQFDASFYSLLFMAQALARNVPSNEIHIGIVSSDMQDITGQEALRPEKATVLGPCKVIPQEYSHLICRSIDIVVPSSQSLQEERLVEQLIAELSSRPANLTVAFRGNHRWVQTLEHVPMRQATAAKPLLKEKGVYLITGGLGQIGLVLAKHLAQSVSARLVLVGRSRLPVKEQWESWLASPKTQGSVRRQIMKLQEIEALGAEVMIASADVTDEPQMQAVIDAVYERFGELHGVIHAAKTYHRGIGSIQDLDRAECEAYFSPKVEGLFVLEKVFRNRRLDFCLLMSTMSAVLGGLGLCAVSAANLFMDAFARMQNRVSRTPYIAVDWDFWRFEEEKQVAIGKTFSELGITPDEGVKVFDMVLSAGAGTHRVVSTGDLKARLAQWASDDAIREKRETKAAAAASLHPRPEMPNPYVEPRNDVERKIAALWQEALGIEQVGIYDNFFELGGHSLLITQMVARVRQLFQTEIPLRAVFEQPTIAGLAKVTEEALIKEIARLSEEEAEQLLG
jgi:acyl transferase domain-containing protein/acyl carrier protein